MRVCVVYVDATTGDINVAMPESALPNAHLIAVAVGKYARVTPEQYRELYDSMPDVSGLQILPGEPDGVRKHN